jgi:L,D-peptidoglycan transpeptidase YkuD (ErfK/YbiS/YcfS/YnhG family)
VDLRAAVLVVLMLTGCSSAARPESTPPSLLRAWPDPDVRAGLQATSRIGVQVRRPLVLPDGPRCSITKALSKAIDRRRPEQVLLVSANGSRARVVGCERVDDEYVRVLGPFAARVGRHGVASRGTKREGDGRTPAGVWALRSGFGTAKNPGLADSFGWFTPGRADVWVDDPASRLYNTHQVGPARGRWHSAEKLRIKPYRTAQVIGYNQARTPGRGSAIFLHRATGRPTAGCVSLGARSLRAVMQWERAGAVIAIS